MEPAQVRPHKTSAQRRSQRVLLSIRILVKGKAPNQQEFSEETMTAVVNAHGALILLAQPVQPGQLLTVQNIKSSEERTCKVVSLGTMHGTKMEVGIEFHEPSPRFWRIAFPPDDWSLRSPEAKHSPGPSTANGRHNPTR